MEDSMRAHSGKLARLGAALLLLGLTGGLQAQEGGHEAGEAAPHHRFGIAGFIGSTRVGGENEFTVGIDGGMRLNSNWSIGAVIERAERERHSTLLLAGVGWHPTGTDLRLQVGLGRKDPAGTTETVLRTAVAYELEAESGWFLKPYLAIDFITNEDNEGVFGVYIGKGF
jgi:hypothetical protein